MYGLSVRSCNKLEKSGVTAAYSSNELAVAVVGSAILRILRLNLGSWEATSCSLINLCHESGSMDTSSLFASPILNSLVHIFSLSLTLFCVWLMFKKHQLALEDSSKGKNGS